jgi:DNA polymerase IV (archaeal DinB-like DNA polymerase)
MNTDTGFTPELWNPRIIMHVDFDYFFAQCEELRRPELKTKPVVVCVFSGRTLDSGVVSTANYVARKYGVKSGMPIRIAKLQLAGVSDAVFLPLDSQYYLQMSESAMFIISSYADRFEQVGVDECYIDISEKAKSLDLAKCLAHEIKNDLRKHTHLSCSIGVAPNKLLAKIASDLQKPDGVTAIDQRSAAESIADMQVGRIPGVGPKIGQRLEALGIKTIGVLAKSDLFTLIEEFGKKTGTYMHNASRGIDNEHVVESKEKQQIMRIITLKSDATESAEMHSELYTLCESVFQAAAHRRLSFKTVGILLIFNNLGNVTRSRSLKMHSSSLESLILVAISILDETMKEVGSIRVRRLGIKLSDFQDIQGQNTILDFMGSGE